MNSYLKYGAAIAAILVVAVVGLVAVGSLTSRGGAGVPATSATAHPASPGPSPTDVASPGPSPTSSAAAFECHGETTGCAGPLTAGEHRIRELHDRPTFTAPEAGEHPLYPTNLRPRNLHWAGRVHRGHGDGTAIAEQTESRGPVPKTGVGSAVQDFITAVQSHPGLSHRSPSPLDRSDSQGQSIDFVVATISRTRCVRTSTPPGPWS